MPNNLKGYFLRRTHLLKDGRQHCPIDASPGRDGASYEVQEELDRKEPASTQPREQINLEAIKKGSGRWLQIFKTFSASLSL